MYFSLAHLSWQKEILTEINGNRHLPFIRWDLLWYPTKLGGERRDGHPRRVRRWWTHNRLGCWREPIRDIECRPVIRRAAVCKPCRARTLHLKCPEVVPRRRCLPPRLLLLQLLLKLCLLEAISSEVVRHAMRLCRWGEARLVELVQRRLEAWLGSNIAHMLRHV